MRYARTVDPPFAGDRPILRIEPFFMGNSRTDYQESRAENRSIPAAVLTEHDTLADAVFEGWSGGVSIHRLGPDGELLPLEDDYAEASRLNALSARELAEIVLLR